MKRFFAWAALLLGLAATALLAWGYTPDRDAGNMRAKYTNAASRFVDIGDGLKVHVRDEGEADGPVLVLLHGSNASLHTWEPWVKRLDDKYRIISVDQIGHGLTGPNPSGDYSIPTFVTMLDAVLMQMGVGRFALAGNSMGGGIAWNYALAHPDKVRALILVDAGGAPDVTPKGLPIGFRIAATPGINRLTEWITPRPMIERSLRQSVSNQAMIDDRMIDRYWELLLYPGNRRATRQRFTMSRIPAEPAKMSRLQMPTLILWGAGDKLIPLSAGHWFARHIPDAKLIVYRGIGHIPMEEAPDRSAADVDAFLKSLPPR